MMHALVFVFLFARTSSAVVGASDQVSLGPVTVDRTVLSILYRLGSSVLTIVVALLLLRLVPPLERLVIQWAAKNEKDPAHAISSTTERRQRVETLTRVTSSAAQALIWSATVMVILGNFGVAIGPLIAGAGIAGVAVGFGAQSILKDFFAGFFILLENQYDVGDTVTIAGVTGTVERMTMRITVLRDANGTAHFIPNSNIGIVANKTYGWGRALVDVVFSPRIAESEVREVLGAVCSRIAQLDGVDRALLEPVTVEGPLEFTPAGWTWRLVGKTHAMRVSEAKQAMISALNHELRTRGFVAQGGVLTRAE